MFSGDREHSEDTATDDAGRTPAPRGVTHAEDEAGSWSRDDRGGDASHRADDGLGDGDYTALATCVTGGKVPASSDDDSRDTGDAADPAQGVHGTVYLRAIPYDFGVAGQLLGSLDTGSLGSLTDLFS